jgi:hypothetical protein
MSGYLKLLHYASITRVTWLHWCRNPLAALELHIPAATLPLGAAQQSTGTDEDDDANQAALSQVRATGIRLTWYQAHRMAPGAQHASTVLPADRVTLLSLPVCLAGMQFGQYAIDMRAAATTAPACSTPNPSLGNTHACSTTLLRPLQCTPTAFAVVLQAEARADVIIESRSGAVLGALTILKEDYFPGMKSTRLPQILPGQWALLGLVRSQLLLLLSMMAMCS